MKDWFSTDVIHRIQNLRTNRAVTGPRLCCTVDGGLPFSVQHNRCLVATLSSLQCACSETPCQQCTIRGARGLFFLGSCQTTQSSRCPGVQMPTRCPPGVQVSTNCPPGVHQVSRCPPGVQVVSTRCPGVHVSRCPGVQVFAEAHKRAPGALLFMILQKGGAQIIIINMPRDDALHVRACVAGIVGILGLRPRPQA